jgi:hypothetical protein
MLLASAGLVAATTANSANRVEAQEVISGAAAVDAWLRLKGDAAGSLTYEWVSGMVFGIPLDEVAVPLFRMESVTLRRFERASDAVIEKSYSCRMYRDHRSGEFIERFVNPLNGKEVPLTTRCSLAPQVRYTAAKIEILSNMKYESSALGVLPTLERITLGEVTVIRRPVRATFTPPNSSASRHELSIDTFTVPTRDFDNPRRRMLAPAYHWESVTQWMGDLAMGDRPGRMLWSISGRSFRRAEDLPADFRAALQRAMPGALERRLE